MSLSNRYFQDRLVRVMGVKRLIIIVIDFLPAIAYSQHLLIDKLTGILNLTLLCLMKVPAENYVVKLI